MAKIKTWKTGLQRENNKHVWRYNNNSNLINNKYMPLEFKTLDSVKQPVSKQ